MREVPFVSVIIVNWNGGEIFQNTLKSLTKLKYSSYEVIVVDNASTDGSIDNLKKGIKLIKNKENLGFAGGNNVGLKYAKGKYILLLNNDTEVSPDLLNVLVAKLESNREFAVIQPKIYLMDEKGKLDNCGSFLTRIGFLEHWGFAKKDAPEFNNERIIFSAKGACILVRKDVIEEVGLFDDDFGSYFEESDFCWRVWLAGYKILYYPKTYIYHKLAYTAKKMNPFSVNYHSYKNRINSLVKNLGLMNLVVILPVHLIAIEGLSFYYILKLHLGEAWIIQKAIWWNIRFLPRTLKKRAKVQIRIRKKSDKEIFRYILHPINIKTYFGYLGRLEKDFEERS
jgi:GT2 family glycosyltransferase